MVSTPNGLLIVLLKTFVFLKVLMSDSQAPEILMSLLWGSALGVGICHKLPDDTSAAEIKSDGYASQCRVSGVII